MLPSVNFIDPHNDRSLLFAQPLGQKFIHRRQSAFGIDHKQNQISLFHGDVRLDFHLSGKPVIQRLANPPGIHQRQWHLDRLGRGRQTVARHARHVVNNGKTPASQPVKNGRLPDIRAANNGEDRDARHVKKQVKEISRARTEAAQKADQIRARPKRGVPKHTSSPPPFRPSATESNTRLRSAHDHSPTEKTRGLSGESRKKLPKSKDFSCQKSDNRAKNFFCVLTASFSQ